MALLYTLLHTLYSTRYASYLIRDTLYCRCGDLSRLTLSSQSLTETSEQDALLKALALETLVRICSRETTIGTTVVIATSVHRRRESTHIL